MPFTKATEEDLATQEDRLLVALSVSTRRRILSLLSHDNGTLSVEELCAYFELEQATVSHHLRMLRRANLIYRRKHGTYHYYSVSHAALAVAQSIIVSIEEHQCAT